MESETKKELIKLNIKLKNNMINFIIYVEVL